MVGLDAPLGNPEVCSSVFFLEGARCFLVESGSQSVFLKMGKPPAGWLVSCFVSLAMQKGFSTPKYHLDAILEVGWMEYWWSLSTVQENRAGFPKRLKPEIISTDSLLAQSLI